MRGNLTSARERARLSVALVFVLGAVASVAEAQPQTVGFTPSKIEARSPTALEGFFKALDRTARRDPGALTRIVHYGDSLIVSDQITRTLRALFQERYGDGGPGFVLAGRPWDWYRREGVRNGASPGWDAYPALSGGPEDGFFGYGGVTFSTRMAKRSVWYRLTETEENQVRASSIDIHYLAQPGGGDLEVIVDGEHWLTLSTEGERPQSAFHRLDLPEGQHEFTLRTSGGPVRLFGAAFERRGPGVVYDTVGINGACTPVLARIDPEHLSQQLRHRSPDLIVVAFGANESNRPSLVTDYHQEVTPVLQNLRSASGGASCLVVSALDRGERGRGDSLSNPLVAQIVESQRGAALSAGCAFFNTYESMGGESSMWRWSQRGLASSDLVHPTPEGAELIGRGLFNALEGAYADWRRSHSAGE